MDSRESGEWITALLIQGLSEEGVACHYAGLLPTPAVARLCAARGYTFGVMVSASHNPYQDNGIKFFSGDGYKLPDAVESDIEALLGPMLEKGPSAPPVQALRAPKLDLHEEYVGWLLGLWRGASLAGRKVVVDAANGAASHVAPECFRALGATVVPVGCRPDGRNINEGCGSLHPAAAARRVVEERADMGFAFDGDADRCMAVDPSGRVLDGDYVLYRDALGRAAEGRLPGNVVVGTVMSNLWLEHALQKAGLRFERAAVGDRYVLERLQEKGGVLGGEPSGHILFLDQATTGDGLLTALTYAVLACRAGGMEALSEGVKPYPQVLKNIRVARREDLDGQDAIQAALAREREALGETGRIVLRYSGTEPLLRLMVEAETQEQVHGVIQRLSGVLVSGLGEA
jgi:phosphoglucosamine mutase